MQDGKANNLMSEDEDKNYSKDAYYMHGKHYSHSYM